MRAARVSSDGRLVLPPEPGTDVVFAGLKARVVETDTAGPYWRTRIQYWANGLYEWVPTDGLKSRPHDVRVHSADDMCGLGELADVTEPAAVVIRPDGSVDAYGYLAVVDQRGGTYWDRDRYQALAARFPNVSDDEETELDRLRERLGISDPFAPGSTS